MAALSEKKKSTNEQSQDALMQQVYVVHLVHFMHVFLLKLF